MDGLVRGRIVLFVVGAEVAAAINRRRTDGASIAERMKQAVPAADGSGAPIYGWPAGAQAHIGNAVSEGDSLPAMVVACNSSDNANLKVILDGTDVYWATSVGYDEGIVQEAGDTPPVVYRPYSWHWMFEKQATRYTPGEDDIRKLAGDEFNNAIPRLAEIVTSAINEHTASMHEARESDPSDRRERVEKILADAKEVQTRHGDSAAYVHVMGDLKRLLDAWPA